MLGVKQKRLKSKRDPQPVSGKRKVVRPEIETQTQAPLEVTELQKLFTAPKELPTVSLREKKLISSKSLQQRKKLPIFDVSHIDYTIISDEELQELKTFEANKTEDEGPNTVNDPRGGTIDNHTLCAECQLDNIECPGHLGVINLNEHIIHPLFFKQVVNVLTSICGSCGGLLLPEDNINKFSEYPSGSKRLQAIAEASKGVPCRRAAREEVEEGITPCISNPIYKYEKTKESGKIFYTRESTSKTADNILSVKEIEIILNSISDKDAQLLGFYGGSHPRRFIMKSLPVIPLCSRAPVVVDGQVKPDDMTTIYKDIIRYNNELKNENLKENDRISKVKNLIFSIEHLINNSDKKYRQGKHVYQSIQDRIQGKEALIRDAIMGKRVNYSGRTVLGPDPTLKFGQIRIPKTWAPYLTQHEIITPENIDKMTSLFKSGRIEFIIPNKGKLEGKYVKVNEKTIKEYDLSIGDEVDRWLEDGDWVIFNRQPTLHKQGIMGYEVVLGDPLTIGLHLGYTKQHNADFDGDEGAVHVPQSEDARREVAGLMNVACNIMNAQTNSNIAGVVFDALTGSYILSLPETVVNEDVFMKVRMALEDKDSFETLNERLEKFDIPKDSGKALLSSLFPKDFYYTKDETVIKDGVLVSGTLNSSNIGSSSGSIIQAIYKDYGMERTVNFLTDIYRAAGIYLNTHGFSVGIDDCYLTGKDPQKVIDYEVQRSIMLVKSMGHKLKNPIEEERREKQILGFLDTAKNLGAKISKEQLSPNNAFNIMARGGAKGSVTNIAQITGILGQQFLLGQRMPEAISEGTRTLPYFQKNDLNPASRGFITNSFLTGLTPAELFFVLASGRIGLTDTATKTAETGHLHHKIVKSLEDVKVVSDGSVRNAANVIFQFTYGDDGFDAAMVEGVRTKTGDFTSFINMKRAVAKINGKYGFHK